MYAILDIETTGGNPKTNKITEIAIFNHDGNSVTKEFQSLVNPEQSIPDFIVRLTGINDEMVRDAPKFYEIAKVIVEMTEGKTIVAHNAAFDFGFLKREFQSLGYSLSNETLCTVKLSRKHIPGRPSYSLGNICKDLGIVINDRHRAAGDALATVKLFEHLNAIDSNLTQDPEILSGVNEEQSAMIKALPNECGIYRFHGKDDEVIYVGKSNKVRTRVRDHFRTRGQRKKMEMIAQTTRLSYELTGSEMVALLYESELIKQLQPRYNRAQRAVRLDWGLYEYENQAGYRALKVGKLLTDLAPIVTFKSRADAQTELERVTEDHHLCQKVNGLYSSEHACFQRMVGNCQGACVGEESPEDYNARVNKAINAYDLQHENFVLIDEGRKAKELSYAIVENGVYLGYGYCKDNGIFDIRQLKLKLVKKSDNKDTRKILRKVIKGRNYKKLILY